MEILESVRQLVLAWRRVSRAFPGRETGELPGLSIAWGGVPYSAWNALIQSRPVASCDALARLGERAADFMISRPHAGLLFLCEDWLPEGVNAAEVLEPLRLKPAWKMTGMVAGELLPPLRALPALTVRRVADHRTQLDLYDLNAAGYGIDPEPGRASAGPAKDWLTDAFGFVAYEKGEPVAGAATFPIDGRLYVGMVATAPHAQRRGYGEAIVRHSLRAAAEATGLRRIVLHASAAGFPLYQRMGFHATAGFAVFYGEF